MENLGMLTEFRNEPFTDFSIAANHEAMKAALSKVKSQLGKKYPLHIGAKKVETEDVIVSTNPSNPKEEIARISKATKEHAEQAMTAALDAFQTWKKVPPVERARYLFKAGAIMRKRRHEFPAWLILEIGKNWAEADADVAEAI